MLVILTFIIQNWLIGGSDKDTGCHETLSLSMMSQNIKNGAEIKMADANALKVNLSLIHMSTPIDVQEKYCITSVRY